MPRYWGIRTAKDRHDLIADSLKSNVLRQGWGWEDLRKIGQLVEANQADAEMASIWRYTKRMLEIEVGDIVLTPHQPDWNINGVWRVTRPYKFDPLPDVWSSGASDFGHTLGVEAIGRINHRNNAVSVPLRRALTSGFRTRMKQLDQFGTEIEALLDQEEIDRANDAAEQFEATLDTARKQLGEAFQNRYHNSDFEAPVGALLEAIYPGAVTRTAGPAEQGRDFVVQETDRLGISRNLVIQVKTWAGTVNEADLKHALGQLERGVDAESGNVDMAVLITLSDTVTDREDQLLAEFEERTKVPARILTVGDTAGLFLDHLKQIELTN